MNDKYIEALKVHQAEYLNTVWKTCAALMVAIGWIMSSDKTREFLSCEPAVKYVGIIVVCLMTAMHLLTLLDLHKKSASITNTLSLEDQLSKAVVSSYEIKRIYVAASFLINGLLYVLLITILLSV